MSGGTRQNQSLSALRAPLQAICFKLVFIGKHFFRVEAQKAPKKDGMCCPDYDFSKFPDLTRPTSHAVDGGDHSVSLGFLAEGNLWLHWCQNRGGKGIAASLGISVWSFEVTIITFAPEFTLLRSRSDNQSAGDIDSFFGRRGARKGPVVGHIIAKKLFRPSSRTTTKRGEFQPRTRNSPREARHGIVFRYLGDSLQSGRYRCVKEVQDGSKLEMVGRGTRKLFQGPS